MPATSLVRRRRPAHDDRPRWQDIPPDPGPDDGEPEYDLIGMMMKIDTLEKPWRDLINEYGYTAVVHCWESTSNPKAAAVMLRQRHENRQRELANARYFHGKRSRTARIYGQEAQAKDR